MNYQLTVKATEDLTDIWQYTFHAWSESQADKYFSELIEACQILANNPNLGKNYPNITTNYFGYLINKHIIFYEISDEGILVIRILHGRADLKNRILN